MWGIIMSLFVLIITLPMIYFVQDVESARYVRDVVYTAADAASVAGACQVSEKPLSYGSYGQVTSYVNIADQPRATDHAVATLLQNLNHLTANGVDLVSYSVTYPAEDQVRVDATVHFTAANLSKALQLFYGSNQTLGTDIHVYAIALVGQPSS